MGLIRRPQNISTASHGAASRERIAVTVVPNGYLWRNDLRNPLHHRAGVTGTAWSGPRFLGVRAGVNRLKDIEREPAGSLARTPDADRLHRHGGSVLMLHANAQR